MAELMDFRELVDGMERDEALDHILEAKEEGKRRKMVKMYHMRDWLVSELGPEKKAEYVDLTREELAEKVVEVIFDGGPSESSGDDDNEDDNENGDDGGAEEEKDEKPKGRSRGRRGKKADEKPEDDNENGDDEKPKGRTRGRRRSRGKSDDKPEPAKRRSRGGKKDKDPEPDEKLQEPKGAPVGVDLQPLLDKLDPILDFVSVAGKKIDKIDKALKNLVTKEDLDDMGKDLDELKEDVYVMSALTEEALLEQEVFNEDDIKEIAASAIKEAKGEDDDSGN